MRTDPCLRRPLGPIAALAVGLGVAVLGTGAGAVSLAAPAAAMAPMLSDSTKPSLAETTAAALRSASVDSDRQAELVASDDQRLIQAELQLQTKLLHVQKLGPQMYSGGGLATLVLPRRRAPYTFDELHKLAPAALLAQPDGSFLLSDHILVAPGATLTISPRRPLVIKMESGPEGFVSLVTQGGRIRLNGTAAAPITFESWDQSRGKQDRNVTDGRAYIRASGQLIAQHTTFSRLGFWSGRTGGVSIVGSDVSLAHELGPAAVITPEPVKGATSKQNQLVPVGKSAKSAQDLSQLFASQISDSTISDNTFGLFITGSSGPRIAHTMIRRSLVDGLVLHRNVDSASVSDVEVDQSGQDGVVVSREVEGSLLTRLKVRRNGRDGIVLAGRPLADGPSASGSSTRAFGNNTLTASESTDNVRIGIHVVGGTAVRVQGNTVSGGRSGIVVSDGATDVDVDSNRVADAAGNGIQVRESQKISVTGNLIRNSPTGIHLRNSVAAIRQNSTSAVTLHGITFVGRVQGSVVAANLLSGSGTSAIDLVRVSDHKEPVLKENDLSGWSRTVTGDSLLSVLLHPLTVIWIFVAIALISMSRPRRGVSRLPYRKVAPIEPPAPNTVLTMPVPPPTPALLSSRGARRSLPEPAPVVFTLPDRRSVEPVPSGMPLPQPRPVLYPRPVQPRAVQSRAVARQGNPAQPSAAGSAASATDPDQYEYRYRPRPGRRPEPEVVPEPELTLAPVSAAARVPVPAAEPEPEPEPAMAGHAVIDLAIRESQLSPAVPRRRRSVGR